MKNLLIIGLLAGTLSACSVLGVDPIEAAITVGVVGALL